MLRGLTLFLALLCLHTSAAQADSLLSTHGGELKEVMHRVQVRTDGDDLIMTVRRAYLNLGDRVEEAEVNISLPAGAVATGLRSKLGNTWYPGELMPAEQASRLYEQLTEHGPVGSQGPALLSFRAGDELRLKIFPIAPKKKATIEYELRVPTCYRNGFQVSGYPHPEEADEGDPTMRTPRLRLSKGTRGVIRPTYDKLNEAEASAVDLCSEDSSWLPHLAEDQQLILVEHAPASPVTARVGAHLLGNRRVISELSIQFAPELAQIPEKAELVFVLDASYSQGADRLAQQLELIEDYLSFLPDASFDIVVYRRRAERLFGSLQPAKKARALFSRLRRNLPALGNGSHFERGVQLAASVFSDSERPQRIIALTDSRLRVDFKAGLLETALSEAPDALMHILSTELGAGAVYEFERADGHELAEVAMATGGMAVQIYGERTTKNANEALLGLVRPVQVDSLELKGNESWNEIPDVGVEGYGHRSMLLLESAPEDLSLQGKIWGKTIQVTAAIDQELSGNLAALIFGRELMSELSRAEQLAAAIFGGAVSPVTSFLARNPQAAPSSYDYDDELGMIGLGGFGTSSSCGCCGIHGVGRAGLAPKETGFAATLSGFLEQRAQACQSLHGGEIDELKLEVETTGKEIVDVVLSSEETPLADCVVEAAWELRLGEFFLRSLGRYEISF
jgi:hypothetical protein